MRFNKSKIRTLSAIKDVTLYKVRNKEIRYKFRLKSNKNKRYLSTLRLKKWSEKGKRPSKVEKENNRRQHKKQYFIIMKIIKK